MAVFLRLAPVQAILTHCQDGCHHPRFAEGDLLSIPVPDTVIEMDAQVVGAYRKSHDLRRQAQALLDRARRAVEVAIEEGEAAGMRLLQP